MVTTASQIGKTGIPSSGNLTSLTVDKVIDIGRSRIPQYLNMVQKHPDMADTFMAMSKDGKNALLKEVGDTDPCPKSPEAIHAITMSVISHAMGQGLLDAAIMLALDKRPPFLSSANVKEVAGLNSNITVMESTNSNTKDMVRMFETHNILGTLKDMEKIADTLKSRIKNGINRANDYASQTPQSFPSTIGYIAGYAYGLGLYETGLTQTKKNDATTSQAHSISETTQNAELAQIIKEYGLIGA